MSSIRVLIVDDSVVVRRWLSDLLTADPDIEVVGSAATASIGIQKISQVNPDVILLDVEMPELDGIEAVKQIRKTWPALPVIMCSSLTEQGASTTLRAISAGASDAIAKPSALGLSGGGDTATFRAEVVAKVKALGRRSPPYATPPVFVAPRAGRVSVSALAIGCSTGGPNALSTLFASLPSDLSVPIFIVQHMPPLFTKILAERLTASSSVRVSEATDGQVVEPGRAYIAPGNYHMIAERDGTQVRLRLNQDPPENSCRPAVDVLFRSLARVYGSGTLAAVLTGMGHDGARGAQEIHAAGGIILVQDAASCVVASMPRTVVERGVAAGEFPIDRIGAELVFRVRRGSMRPSLVPGSSPMEAQRW